MTQHNLEKAEIDLDALEHRLTSVEPILRMHDALALIDRLRKAEAALLMVHDHLAHIREIATREGSDDPI